MRIKADRDADKDLRKYTCPWCGYKFEMLVGTYNGTTSQVRCKHCQNYMGTKSGIIIKKGKP